MGLTRRGFIAGCALVASAAAVPAWLWRRGRTLGGRLAAMLPIDRSVDRSGAARFSGDDPDGTHRLLWDIPQFVRDNGLLAPAQVEPDERTSLVIVGGGIGGLGTAWLLRDKAPVVLERAERFGGNARGESWDGIDYSIGAAYLLAPDPGTPLEALYQEWGIESLCRARTEEDPVLIDGRIYHDFWSGESDPDAREGFTAVRQYFIDVWNGDSTTPYPEMPTDDPVMLATLAELDGHSFREHLESIFEGPLHPHVAAVIDHYCWSSLGGTWEEVGAAAGLNFFAAEFGTVWVAPGGNAAVAERVLTMLERELPGGHLRPSSTVFNVSMRDDGVLVHWVGPDGAARSILADAVALCCPKFVVRRILDGIEPERAAAIAALRYRSYLLANVLVNGEVPNQFYDLFLADVDSSQATDVVTATWARPVQGRTVLTLYRALPFDDARPTILAAGSYQRFRSEFEAQIRGTILPALGLAADQVVDIRLTRWGHPLPLAGRGLVGSGWPGVVRAPFGERVFFVEQDNWALPAIETSLEEALYFAPRIRAVLS